MVTFKDALLGEEIEYYLDAGTEPAAYCFNDKDIERGILIGQSQHHAMIGFMLQPRKGKYFPLSFFTWESHPDMKFVPGAENYPYYVFAESYYRLHSIIGRTFRASGPTTNSAELQLFKDEAKFFSAVAAGNCACNLPKQSCNYHKD